MNKLLDLLNEREEEVKSSKIKWEIDYNPVGIYGYVWRYWLWFASKMIIISKEYWFIKWLVEKDLIDFSRDWEYCIKSIEEFDWLLRDNEDWLLMLLAISDAPIDDLISYLK